VKLADLCLLDFTGCSLTQEPFPVILEMYLLHFHDSKHDWKTTTVVCYLFYTISKN
jgi:hypothetical protein